MVMVQEEVAKIKRTLERLNEDATIAREKNNALKKQINDISGGDDNLVLISSILI